MENKTYPFHEPVLLAETLNYLNIDKLAHLHGTKVIDATLGFGGHTIEILKRGVSVLGIEADRETLKLAKNEIADACPASENKFGSYKLIHSNFKDIDQVALENGFEFVDGFLFDLGVSTFQLTSKKRGLSFIHPRSHLDMRIDTASQAVDASMLLNALDQTQLSNLFAKVFHLGLAKKIALAIVRQRVYKPFVTVEDLLNLVAKLPKTASLKINPATKIFMALRMAVNSELENLSESLPKAFSLLNESGRLVVIYFHSGEDSIVKSFMKKMVDEKKAVRITSKPVVPSGSEISKNPRSRSAKLRCIEKI